ncbi:MAG: hypothetical protein J6Y62_01715 [Clostridia bacterium]|nr:hypothetical protein [Clostridia bacterium]
MMDEGLKKALTAMRDSHRDRQWTMKWNIEGMETVFRNIVMVCTGNAVVYRAESDFMRFEDEPCPAIRAGHDYLDRFLRQFDKDFGRLKEEDGLLLSMGFKKLIPFQKYFWQVSDRWHFFLERFDSNSGKMKFRMWLADIKGMKDTDLLSWTLGEAETEVSTFWKGEDLLDVLAEYFKYICSGAMLYWSGPGQRSEAGRFGEEGFKWLFPSLPAPVRGRMVEKPSLGYEIKENQKMYFRFDPRPWKFDLGGGKIAVEKRP